MNPPYGREQKEWIEKAIDERIHENVFIVALLPARTDTQMFHLLRGLQNYCYIQLLPGRLTFKGCDAPAPFPSMLVYFL